MSVLISTILILRQRRIGYGGGLDDLIHDLGGQVAAEGKHRLQVAMGINDERAHIMIEGAVAVLNDDPGSRGKLVDFVFRAGEKTPVRGIVLIEPGVGFQYFHRVKFRVEGNR